MAYRAIVYLPCPAQRELVCDIVAVDHVLFAACKDAKAADLCVPQSQGLVKPIIRHGDGSDFNETIWIHGIDIGHLGILLLPNLPGAVIFAFCCVL